MSRSLVLSDILNLKSLQWSLLMLGGVVFLKLKLPFLLRYSHCPSMMHQVDFLVLFKRSQAVKSGGWDVLAFHRWFHRQKQEEIAWQLPCLHPILPVLILFWRTLLQQCQDNPFDDNWLYLPGRDFWKEIDFTVLIIFQTRVFRRILKFSQKSTAYRYMASQNFWWSLQSHLKVLQPGIRLLLLSLISLVEWKLERLTNDLNRS